MLAPSRINDGHYGTMVTNPFRPFATIWYRAARISRRTPSSWTISLAPRLQGANVDKILKSMNPACKAAFDNFHAVLASAVKAVTVNRMMPAISLGTAPLEFLRRGPLAGNGTVDTDRVGRVPHPCSLLDGRAPGGETRHAEGDKAVSEAIAIHVANIFGSIESSVIFKQSSSTKRMRTRSSWFWRGARTLATVDRASRSPNEIIVWVGARCEKRKRTFKGKNQGIPDPSTFQACSKRALNGCDGRGIRGDMCFKGRRRGVVGSACAGFFGKIINYDQCHKCKWHFKATQSGKIQRHKCSA